MHLSNTSDYALTYYVHQQVTSDKLTTLYFKDQFSKLEEIKRKKKKVLFIS